MKQTLADPAGPLAFFAYTYVHGGGSHSTEQILRELVQDHDSRTPAPEHAAPR